VIPAGRVLGVDLGSRRIGVAVTDSGQRVATGLTTLLRSGDRRVDHHALAALIADYEAVGLVIGLPVSLSGELGPAARTVLEEVDEIDMVVGVAVETIDERLTTVTAAGALRASGLRSRDQRHVIDRSAAAVLLQTWAERRANGTDG